MKINKNQYCGCIAKIFYGCIRCGKEVCDKKDNHSPKYDQWAIIDRSKCLFKPLEYIGRSKPISIKNPYE